MNIKRILLVFLIVSGGAVGVRAQDKILGLAEVKSLALQNNKKLKKAQNNIESAIAAKKASDVANRPTLDGSITGTYFTEPLTAFLPEVMGNASLSVTQVIYAGGKIKNAGELSSVLVDIQKEQKVLTEDEVLLKTETAYWQIINVKDKIILAKEYIRLLNALRRDLKNVYDAGLTYKNDLLKVEVQLNEAELNLTKANDGLTLAKLNLAQLIGNKNLDFDVEDNLTGNFGLVSESDIENSIEKRPEISILSKSVSANEIQERLLEGDRKPTVAFSGYGFAGLGKNANPVNGKDNVKGFVGLLSVNVPLYDWGARKQKVKEQHYKTEARKIELEEARELLELEAQSSWLALNQSVKKIELAERSKKQAEENLRLNQDRFEAGTVIGEEVLKAQVLWQQANTDIIDAQTEYKINEANYKKAIGEY
ncbi:TolC family protein [Chryseobacterium populi]|uniref:Outer membrane protein n=1 Tax=Chryseobacterium populi TaxID=1144316 RepID=J3CCJ1_9FLAO|nr:TolC family protein [Chryseobacterium populi]EJL68716.1 outer membrane protein [Chryseobacterium populi]